MNIPINVYKHGDADEWITLSEKIEEANKEKSEEFDRLKLKRERISAILPSNLQQYNASQTQTQFETIKGNAESAVLSVSKIKSLEKTLESLRSRREYLEKKS